ncbi:MAG TPA: hypothetical protein VKU86_14825 [Acidimicrobiales bacterium]|nr:hypothetical protein [Acidimicrobiales bacterium]
MAAPDAPSAAPHDGRFVAPALILAADHRARGVMTIEPYARYLDTLSAVLPYCDGILASAQPLRDLTMSGAVAPAQRTYLSINRTGLAGSVFELDDRLVASVKSAATEGWTGVKHMTRVDLADPATAGALELLGRVIEESHALGLEALVEALSWRDGKMARDTDSIVLAAVIAHDMGAPVLKVPVPDEPGGRARTDAVARVVSSVGVPVLFLGGPRAGRDSEAVLAEVSDVMAGGGAGMAIGRVLFEDPDPVAVARAMSELVHSGVDSRVDGRVAGRVDG